MQPSPDETRRDAAEDTQWSRPECQVWTGTLLLGTCLLYCARVSMPVCAASMSQDFGWNKKEAGVVLSSFFWGYCLTQVVGGHLGDRIGGEKVILLSASAWGFITVATPLLAHLGSAHLAFMTFSRILTGLLQEPRPGVGLFPAHTARIPDILDWASTCFLISPISPAYRWSSCSRQSRSCAPSNSPHVTMASTVCPAAEAGLSCVTPGWGLPTAPGWVAVSSAVSSHLPRRQKDFSVWPVTVKRPGVQGQFSPWVTSTWCGQCWVPKGRWGPCPVLVPWPLSFS